MCNALDAADAVAGSSYCACYQLQAIDDVVGATTAVAVVVAVFVAAAVTTVVA